MIPVVTFILGVLGNVFIPYLIELRDNVDDPGKFSWKYVWPKILSAIILLVTLPLIFPDLASVPDMGWQQSFIAGYGVSELGELVRKGYKVYKTNTDQV